MREKNRERGRSIQLGKTRCIRSSDFLILNVESHMMTMNSFRILTSNYGNLSKKRDGADWSLQGSGTDSTSRTP